MELLELVSARCRDSYCGKDEKDMSPLAQAQAIPGGLSSGNLRCWTSLAPWTRHRCTINPMLEFT